MSSISTGRLVGALFIPIGGVASWLAHSMLASGAPTLRVLTAGPALVLLGLALMVFPGAPRTVAQTRQGAEAQREWVTQAPGLHKAAWVVAVGLGLLCSRWLGLD
jgi:hypothetical protein